MFTFGKKYVYLDHAASTPPCAEALAAFKKASRHYANPSSLHIEGVRAHAVLAQARKEIAALTDVRASGITFTSGATEANNLAIIGIVENRIAEGVLPKDIHILYHPGAHASVVETVLSLKARGVKVEELALSTGEFDLAGIKKQLQRHTVLVAVEAVSGETGMIFDTRGLRRVLDAYGKTEDTHIMLHVDASQAPQVQNVSLIASGADTMALDAQKIGGVRGIGVLAKRHDVKIAPLMHGGPQEEGLRPGTEHPALALAFARALSIAQENREEFVSHTKRLRDRLLESVSQIENTVVHNATHQAPHIFSLSLVGRDTDYLLFLLDAKGFAVSTRSACEGDAGMSRAVLSVAGDEAVARSTLRVSFSKETTQRDVTMFGSTLQKCVRFLDENALK